MKIIAALAALAACGSPAPATPDAPIVTDAAPDGLPADAGPVTVNAPYLDASNRITPGATVLFYDRAGVLVDRVTTDANGRATGMCRPDGMVLVLPPGGARRDYYSWYSVMPGDELTTRRVPPPAPATHAERDVSVILRREFSDYTHYAVGAVGLSVATNVSPGNDDVVLGATLDADAPLVGDVVAKSTDSTGTHVDYIVAHQVRLDTGLVDLRGEPWRYAAPFSWSILPHDGCVYDFFDCNETVSSITGDYEQLSGGRVLWKEPAQVSQTSGGFTQLAFDYPDGAGDARALAVSYEMSDGTHWALSWNGATNGDLSPHLAPLVHDISRGSVNAITWQQSGGSALGVEVTLTVDDAAWHIVLPPDRTSFTPPPIPPDLAGPPAMVGVRVLYVGGNEPGGYRALRTDPDVFDPYHWAQVVPTQPGIYRYGGTP